MKLLFILILIQKMSLKVLYVFSHRELFLKSLNLWNRGINSLNTTKDLGPGVYLLGRRGKQWGSIVEEEGDRNLFSSGLLFYNGRMTSELLRLCACAYVCACVCRREWHKECLCVYCTSLSFLHFGNRTLAY